MTEPIQAIAAVSHPEARIETTPHGTQPTGVPNQDAVNAFHAALHGTPNVDGPEVIGTATSDPGERFVATIGRIEHDVNQWVAHLQSAGSDELLNPQQIFAQMIHSGQMSVQLSLLTNLSKEMSEGVHTLFQQQN